MNDGNVYLVHHGVKGMKWGQRKQRNISSNSKNNRHSVSDKTKSPRHNGKIGNKRKKIKKVVKNVNDKIEKGKNFVDQNGQMIAVAAASSALAFSGMAYVTPLLTTAVAVGENVKKVK